MKKGQRKAIQEKIAKMKPPKGDGFLEMLAPEHVKRAAKAAAPPAEKPVLDTSLIGKALREMAADMLAKANAPSVSFPTPSYYGAGMAGQIFSVNLAQMVPTPFPFLREVSCLERVAPRKIPAPEKPMPDYVQAITAWRAWKVERTGDGLRLRSIGRDQLWEPRQPKNATCLDESIRYFGYELAEHHHPAPHFACQCGIWAFKDLSILVSALEGHPKANVLGTVSLWGNVVETTNGYRAQHAYPAELWLLQEGLEDLGWIYNVPVRSLS